MKIIIWLIAILVAIIKMVIYWFKIIKAWFHWFWAKKVLKYEFKWNPFVKFPRNDPCYCGSGLKYKKCCLHGEPEAIRSDIAAKVSKLVKKARAKHK